MSLEDYRKKIRNPPKRSRRAFVPTKAPPKMPMAAAGYITKTMRKYSDGTGNEIKTGTVNDPNVFNIFWGSRRKWGEKCCVVETGFLYNSMQIDTQDLYEESSLNRPEAKNIIDRFRAPRNAIDIISSSNYPRSKFRQPHSKRRWTGIVLALQKPNDRSINRVASAEEYYSFVERACRRYQKHLFLKLHPRNGREVAARFRSLADNYRCRIGRVDHSVIESCKFVLVFNSGFAVDCMVRGVRVAQFAPGYFYKTGAVYYTDGQLPDSVPDIRNKGYKLADFLIHKYMFDRAMPVNKWLDMFKIFATSDELFPMKPEHCYANNIGQSWSS